LSDFWFIYAGECRTALTRAISRRPGGCRTEGGCHRETRRRPAGGGHRYRRSV